MGGEGGVQGASVPGQWNASEIMSEAKVTRKCGIVRARTDVKIIEKASLLLAPVN